MSRSKPLWQNGVIKELANEYNIEEEKIEEAVYYQFKYLKKIMKEGNFESVRLRRFGKFYVKEGRLKHLKSLNKKD